jgi:hypothetical protein
MILARRDHDDAPRSKLPSIPRPPGQREVFSRRLQGSFVDKNRACGRVFLSIVAGFSGRMPRRKVPIGFARQDRFRSGAPGHGAITTRNPRPGLCEPLQLRLHSRSKTPYRATAAAMTSDPNPVLRDRLASDSRGDRDHTGIDIDRIPEAPRQSCSRHTRSWPLSEGVS